MMFKLALFATLASIVAAQAGTGSVRPLGNMGFCLDVRGANFADGTVVQLYSCNGTPAQQWTLNIDGNADGYGSISTVAPDGARWCVDREDVGADGTKTTLRACRGRVPSQSFFLDQEGTHQFRNDDRVRCLDVTDGNFANGNQLQVWTCNSSPNQIWGFFP